jgi:hypothetical protein
MFMGHHDAAMTAPLPRHATITIKSLGAHAGATSINGG